MPNQILNLIKGDKAGSETDYRDALPTNMVAVIKEIFGVRGYMIQYPGLTFLGDGGDPCRGGIWNERFKELYRVHGESFLSVDKDGNTNTLGSISGSSTVSLPYSFNTQAIIGGGNYYLYDSTNGFRQVTDTDVGNPIDATWINGYYFFTDGEFIYHTDIGDEESIDPLKFSTSEFSPDPTLGVAKTQDNKVAVFNRYSVEYFRDVASDNFAFTRIEQRAIKIGIVGTHCKCEMGARFYILGGRKEESVSCHSVAVGSSEKIATREIDQIIGQYTEEELSNSVVECYAEDGNNYVVYHLPNETLLFNETVAKKSGIEQAWTRLGSGIETYTTYRGIHYVNDARLGKWTLGDKTDGSIGVLDEKEATQYGNISEWTLFTPFTYLETTSIDELEVETLPGFNDKGDATVFLSLTYEGVAYGNQETILYGQPGNYTQRFIVRRLGYVRDWFSFRLRGATRSRMAFSRMFITYG